MISNRRQFLMGCSTAIAALAGARLGPMAFASGAGSDNGEVLVVVFLRGGMDGLNLVPPIAGPDRAHYEEARPQLKVPVTGNNAALPLNAQFGLHPSAQGLRNLFTMGRLAIVHAVGTSGTRSHFDAMRSIELGTPGSKALATGWITRHLQTAPTLPKTILMPALAVGGSMPTSLQGSAETVNMTSLGQFSLSNIGHWSWATGDQRTALRRLYARGSSQVHQAGIQALNAAGLVEGVAGGAYTPSAGVTYPGGGFSEQLKLIAQMIKLQVGLRVAAVDLGGWDTHESQGMETNSYYGNLVRTLSDGLAAFYADLDRTTALGLAKRLTIVVQSEFGRRVQENAQRGTDHGTANPMLIIGGNVNGGIFGQWPGLHPDQRFEGADLTPTLDYRTVLSEIILRRFGNPHLGDVFPEFRDYAPLNLIQGAALTPVYTTQKPPAPANFAILRTGASSIRLTWTTAPNATNYRLERRAQNGTEWTHRALLTSETTQFEDFSEEAATSSYRIQAYNSGGESDYSRAVALTESPMTPLEQWRLQHFGTNENFGTAADNHVTTADGLNNFSKYALGLNPSFPAPAVSGFAPGKPTIERSGSNLSLVYTRPVERTDVRFEVLYSKDLVSWTPVADTSDGKQNGMERRRATVPADGYKQFMKLNAIRLQ